MITITTTNGKEKIFKDYHQVCEYISSIERQKKLEAGTKIWRFTRHRHQTLFSLYWNPLLKGFLTAKEKEAVEKEKGLIEIVKGNRGHITQLLLTNRLDVESLKRDWCKDYCIEHEIKHSELVVKD